MKKKFNRNTLKCTVVACMAMLLIGLAFPLSITASDSDGTYAPTFKVIDGRADSSGADYCDIYDGDLSTKYCIVMDPAKKPYVTFQASNLGTVVTGYTLYTGDDTATYKGRNPANWTLYGSNDANAWTPIHTVTGDTSIGEENKKDYSFSFENTTPYYFYKFEISARRTEFSDSYNLVQLSEIEFTATVDTSVGAEANVSTEQHS